MREPSSPKHRVTLVPNISRSRGPLFGTCAAPFPAQFCFPVAWLAGNAKLQPHRLPTSLHLLPHLSLISSLQCMPPVLFFTPNA